MNRLFGTSKQQPPPQQPAPPKEQPKPVDLSEQAQRTEAKVQALTEQVNNLDKEIAENYAKSKKMKGVQANTAKQRCVMLLKKKRLYEQQLSSLLNNQLTLDQMAFTKENIQNTLEMTAAMQQQMAAQKELFKDVDMDKIEDMMDDMEDMKMDSDYMNEMMNRNYAVDIDEDELDREMQEIDNDIYMNALQNQNNTNKVPAYYQNMMQGQQQSQAPQVQNN